jgi:EAL domain-containing protein (putative c-di-GMP-specific phosphodiesterase class I)
MKKTVSAIVLCAALGGFAALPAQAQSTQAMQAVKAMKTDSNGMITKAEFMRMVEQKWDAMALVEKDRLTPTEAAKLLEWLAAGGTAP